MTSPGGRSTADLTCWRPASPVYSPPRTSAMARLSGSLPQRERTRWQRCLSTATSARLRNRSGRDSGRQEHPERGAPGLGVDLDAALVFLDHDVVADVEAEPSPLAGRLGGKERVEHPRDDLGRYPRAVVFDLGQDVAVLR